MARIRLFVLGAVINAALSSTIADAKSRDRNDIAYGCDDLVVVGRLEKQDYQHVEIEKDDSLSIDIGHGWVTAEVRVDDVVFGHTRARKLPVRYFAHSYMREDRDFVFVLRPAENGRHLVRIADLVENDREVANRCSQ